MRALVVGYGSIGARHARLLQEAGYEVHVVTQRTDAPFPTVHSPADISGTAYELAVIATPTVAHAADFLTVAQNSRIKRILLEKPVFSAVSHIPDTLPAHAPERTYVGYNLRFHPVIERARRLLEGFPLYSACFYAGQYLPDWRPGADYRCCYSADAQSGGGVLRDLSHELDIACFLAGSWQKLASASGKVSALEINSEDVCSILSVHKRCPHVCIHLNYLDRKKGRFFTINYQHGTLHGDLANNTLTWNGGTEYFDCTADTTYALQLADLLQGGSRVCTFADGVDVLRMIAATETAARETRWVKNDL